MQILKKQISDADLIKAAKLVGKAMRESLPDPGTCQYEFSPEFEERIFRIGQKAKRRRILIRYTRRVAAIFAVVLLSTSVWLAIDTTARAEFFAWVREVYENSIIYRFRGEATEGDLPECTVTWLPEGYSSVSEDKTQTTKYITYSDGEKEIYLNWRKISSSTISATLTDDIETKTVFVNGISAELIVPIDKTMSTELIWVDQEAGLIYSLSGVLAEEDLLRIAESISVAKED